MRVRRSTRNSDREPPPSSDEEAVSPPAPTHAAPIVLLTLAALGVVYGDIGTSPLYALRECFAGHYPLEPTPENVLGVLSLLIWALIVLVTVKYVLFVLRADNRGEGGILALTALVTPVQTKSRISLRYLLPLGLFGGALLYGDALITPAISVLSAVEGLSIATPLFEPYILPITVVVLIGLFAFQKHGTARVGTVFGPVMLAWFSVLALLGMTHLADEPGVLAAFNPYHAVAFFSHNGGHGFFVLGSVFLVVTGGEAIYADMGHFGVGPIRRGWFLLVLPALLLNYLGQGALLLIDPSAVQNPFYRLVPEWALYPMVVLATLATITASQAVISGAFSLTMQAVQLGFLPRLEIRHTSAGAFGQIFVPAVNTALMLFCILLVVGFGTSSDLAAAYGVAVTGTMLITTVLFYRVVRHIWGWRPLGAILLCGLFLTVEGGFFAANIVKVAEGGWFPLVVAAVVFTVMVTWNEGRRLLEKARMVADLPVEDLLSSMKESPTPRVPGTAVFMTGTQDMVPRSLLHSLKHMKVLHERVVLLSVVTREIPHVPADEQVHVRVWPEGFFGITLSYGFMETPDVPADLQRLRIAGLTFKRTVTSYFLGRENLLVTKKTAMARWRKSLFAFISRNSRNAPSYFGLPPERVVEFGAQVEF